MLAVVNMVITASTFSDTLARVGDRLYKEAGGGKARDQAAEQWPLYGHGNDMFFCNPMYGLKTAGKDEQLFENQVASSEAFLYWKGVGAAGFEQNFIVTKDAEYYHISACDPEHRGGTAAVA